MNRALLVDILEERYDVVEAENGVEAISLLSKQRADFSLLLLDIMMPEMDGFEVLACINKYHWNDTFAVIMISADDTPANIKRAYDLGAFDYISYSLIQPLSSVEFLIRCFYTQGSSALKNYCRTISRAGKE